MKVRVLFFGAVADAVSVRDAEVELSRGSRVSDAVWLITDKNPKLRGRKLLVALNEEYVTGEETVNDADEIALFTAVSGG